MEEFLADFSTPASDMSSLVLASATAAAAAAATRTTLFRPFQCPQCFFTTTNEKNLKCHIERVHHERCLKPKQWHGNWWAMPSSHSSPPSTSSTTTSSPEEEEESKDLESQIEPENPFFSSTTLSPQETTFEQLESPPLSSVDDLYSL